MINEESIIQTRDLFDKTEELNAELDKYYITEESSKEAKDIASKFVGNLDSKNEKIDKKNSKSDKSLNKYFYKSLKKKKVKIYKNPYVKSRSKFIGKINKFFKALYNLTGGIRNFFKIIINAIIKKGNNERSILLFYNDDEKGIRLPINNFIILYLLLIFSSLVYTGIDAYYRQKNAGNFYIALSDREAQTYKLIQDYKTSINRYSAALIDYNNYLKNISYSIDYNDSYSIKKNETTNINKILNEVDIYQKNILSFLKISSILHKEIPTGWPVAGGGRISSGFGARLSPFTKEKSYHYGVDIAGPYGTPILAVADGVISYAGWRNGYGWFLIINHANGYQTAYGHNSKLLVNVGHKVKRGDKIALIGNTGRTTGIHCHFEVRINGDHKNPMPYLSARF